MSAISGWRPTRVSPWSRIGSSEPLDVMPVLLAILVVPTGRAWAMVAGVGGATLVAIWPRVRRDPLVWLVIGGLRLGYQFTHWPGVDDHEVLISYSCLALGLALWSREPHRVARRSLLTLVGLTMAFATIWKVGSGQFLDGDTMRYTLLTDPRFEPVSSRLGGMSDAAIAANDAAMATLRDPAGADTVSLIEPARLTGLAYLLTAGAVLVEGALAIMCLSHRSDAVRRAWVLAGFCAATYLIVPVGRFGLILTTGVYAGSEGRRDRAVLLSTAAFCVIWPPLWSTLGGPQ